MGPILYTVRGQELHYVDVAALPELTRAKLARRDAAGHTTAVPNLTPPRSSIHAAKAMKPQDYLSGVLAAVAMGLFGGIAFGEITGFVVAGVVLSLLFFILCVENWPEKSTSIMLNDSDISAMRQATVVLPLPSPAPISEISLQSFGEERVRMLISGVLDVGDSIARSKSWRSSYLEPHRVQLDPNVEVQQVLQHALALRKAVVKLGDEPTGSSASAVVAQRAFSIARNPLNIVWDRLIHRVRALSTLHSHLLSLDVELERIEDAQRAMRMEKQLDLNNVEAARRATSIDDEVGELLTNAVGDEFAAEHLRHLSEEADALRACLMWMK